MSGNPKSILKNPTFKATPPKEAASPFTLPQKFESATRALDEKMFKLMNPDVPPSQKQIEKIIKEQEKQAEEDKAKAEIDKSDDPYYDPDQAGYFSDRSKGDDSGSEDVDRIAALEEFYLKYPPTPIAEIFPKMGTPRSPPPSLDRYTFAPRSPLDPEMLLGGIPKPPLGGKKTKKTKKTKKRNKKIVSRDVRRHPAKRRTRSKNRRRLSRKKGRRERDS
jgi:hypothetical protein